jgi:hypothetical protein
MQTKFAASLALSLVILCLTSVSAAQGRTCSIATGDGAWAFTYSGTVILPTGPVPVASTGRFSAKNGSLSGTETRSLAGSVADETITATYTVNTDCTATYNFEVFDSGVLVRTAKVNVVYDNNGRSVRGIFTSLVLADGPALPNVITVDAAKIFPGE